MRCLLALSFSFAIVTASSGVAATSPTTAVRAEWLTLGNASAAVADSAAFSQRVRPGADGRLTYPATDDGLAIPDFSTAGYRSGGVALPDVPVRRTLAPVTGGGDDRDRIQAAIDEVSQLPRNERGLRGAVLLQRGQYRVNGTVLIAASGVVLRGEGPDVNGTVITATLPKQHTVIEVHGAGALELEETSRQAIVDARVLAGARSFRVANAAGFKVGDRVVVHRPSTREWIAVLGMDKLTESPKPGVKNWSPGGFDLRHDRM